MCKQWEIILIRFGMEYWYTTAQDIHCWKYYYSMVVKWVDDKHILMFVHCDVSLENASLILDIDINLLKK